MRFQRPGRGRLLPGLHGQHQVHPTQVGTRRAVPGVAAQRVLQRLQCQVGPAGAGLQQGDIVIGVGQFRVFLREQREHRQRFFVALQVHQHYTMDEARLRVTGLVGERAFGALQCTGQVAGGQQGLHLGHGVGHRRCSAGEQQRQRAAGKSVTERHGWGAAPRPGLSPPLY